MFLIIITTSRPHILLASYDTSPHTHSTTSPHKNLNYLYINIRKIITFHDNTTTTKSIKTGWVHEYIGLHFFFICSILKWYTLQWGWTGTHFPNREPLKTCIQNTLKVDDALGTPSATSRLLPHTADSLTLNCSWRCDLLVVFSRQVFIIRSRVNTWGEGGGKHRLGRWVARLRVCAGRVLGESSTHEAPWFTSLIILGIKM